MLRHGLNARARSLSWCAHLPDCVNLVPVLLTWQAPCTTDSPFTPYSHSNVDYFGRDRHGNGLNTKHLLQLSLKLTLSGPSIVMLPLCTEALAITVSF
jgi:hypothetical protein